MDRFHLATKLMWLQTMKIPTLKLELLQKRQFERLKSGGVLKSKINRLLYMQNEFHGIPFGPFVLVSSMDE